MSRATFITCYMIESLDNHSQGTTITKSYLTIVRTIRYHLQNAFLGSFFPTSSADSGYRKNMMWSKGNAEKNLSLKAFNYF